VITFGAARVFFTAMKNVVAHRKTGGHISAPVWRLGARAGGPERLFARDERASFAARRADGRRAGSPGACLQPWRSPAQGPLRPLSPGDRHVRLENQRPGWDGDGPRPTAPITVYGENRTVGMAGLLSVQDTFAPYAVHIYVVR
jgi:hypothetical protein